MSMKESYRIDEVAKKLNVSRRTVERALRRGELNAFRIGSDRRIPAAELERIRKNGSRP